ncbi:hypothetical protein DFH09DRAFT_1320246 [Mycena vulgaris]|nr:hypothetical protein DFH09DRAFT_1320246 [Mycena vulgaris]
MVHFTSGRSLRDTQPLPSIGAAFPLVPRLDSDRAPDGDRTLPAAFTRAAPAMTRGHFAPLITAGDAAPCTLHPPGDPLPTAPAPTAPR